MLKCRAFFVIITWLVLVVLVIIHVVGIKDETEKDVFFQISEAPCAKFEYINELEHPLYITSEIKTLSMMFESLVLVKGDIVKYDEKWIYRIVFNCKELIANSSEIVVLVGENNMWINDVVYTTPEPIEFDTIVRVIRSKYDFFSDEKV